MPIPAVQHASAPIEAHLDAYSNHLLGKGDTAKHARLTASRLRKVMAGCGFASLGDLDAAARFHLYALACGTGFRAAALASLTPGHFDLAGPTPTVTLARRADKSRRGKVQPLPADVAELMRGYLAGRPAGAPVWPGGWARRSAEMLRIDLA